MHSTEAQTHLEILNMPLPGRPFKTQQPRRVRLGRGVPRLDELHLLRLGDPARWVGKEERREGFLPDAAFGMGRGGGEVKSELVLAVEQEGKMERGRGCYRGENMSMPEETREWRYTMVWIAY